MPCEILCFFLNLVLHFVFLVGYLVSDTPLKGPCLMTRRQSPPIASLFATAPIDAGPNSKCCIFRDFFVVFYFCLDPCCEVLAGHGFGTFWTPLSETPLVGQGGPTFRWTPMTITSLWSEPIMEGPK